MRTAGSTIADGEGRRARAARCRSKVQADRAGATGCDRTARIRNNMKVGRVGTGDTRTSYSQSCRAAIRDDYAMDRTRRAYALASKGNRAAVQAHQRRRR